MIGSLPLFHRVRDQRVVVIGDGDMADAKRRLVERAGAIPCAETEAHHARLGFVALEDGKSAEAAANRLRGRGLLVNVADRPDLCDFTLPSILDREPVLVAISTSGASAGLAKQLRLRLEQLLPQSLGRLVTALNEARGAIREKFPSPDARRRALDAALDQSGPLDPLDETAPDRIGEWLAAGTPQQQSQQTTIALISNDPDDLTLRQARLLGTADTLFVGPGVAPAILARARADAARHDLADKDSPPEGLSIILIAPTN